MGWSVSGVLKQIHDANADPPEHSGYIQGAHHPRFMYVVFNLLIIVKAYLGMVSTGLYHCTAPNDQQLMQLI